MSGYTEEELSGLSAEEREALEDTTEEEREALNAIVDDEDDNDDDKSSYNDEDDLAKAIEEDQIDPDEDNERTDFVPTYRSEPVEDYADKVAALDAQFQDGEIELKEYNQQRDSLVMQNLKAEIAAEQNEQVSAQLWDRQIADFMEDHPEYTTSKIRHVALDSVVKDLGSNPANADKPGRWFLREAHKIVQAEFGGGTQEKPAETSKPVSRKPDLSTAPKTLANVPPADNSGEATNEFAKLDKLVGLEHERELARLSPDQQARYLAS